MKRLGYFLLGVISGFLSVTLIIRKIWKIISRSPLVVGEFARAIRELIYALLFGEEYHPRYTYRGPVTYYKPQYTYRQYNDIYKERKAIAAEFKTKREAEEVIEKLKDICNRHGNFTINDFYQESGNTNTPEPADFSRGWCSEEDLDNIEIIRPAKKNGKWILRMPEWRYLK